MVDRQIEIWAHMLDESFAKSDKQSAVPKDENEKFKFGDVFADQDASPKELEKQFDALWPKWWDYFTSEVSKLGEIDIEGQRRDVDDWDMWKIAVADCYGGENAMADMMFDDFYGRWNDDKVTSMKEIIDTEIERLAENAANECSPEKLEQYGRCIYRGRMRWGGYYPG